MPAASGRLAALVLAAGSASRLGSRPKCLLELDGVPLLRRLVDALVGYNAGRVFGADGMPAVAALPGDATLGALAEFEVIDIARVGADIVHQWRRR